MDETDAVVIEGLEFYGFHGATDAEQTIGHRYKVDVRLAVDTRLSGQSDRLTETVSYAEVAHRIVEIGATVQFRLLEKLAAECVAVLFDEFPSIQAIRLKIVKIAPPMNAIVASVGVEIARQRQ